MARRFFFTFTLLLLSSLAVAQTASDRLVSFNEKQIRIKKIGMITLGSWAVGNMAVSGFSINGASGSNRHFHQMNVYWNVVNLALAGFGYYGAARANPSTTDLARSIKDFYGMEKTLLLNAGLDVGYILGGLYLTEKARNSESRRDMLRGFGQSVMMQGGFLLLFDTVLYLVFHQQEKELPSLLSTLRFTCSGIALAIRL